MPDQPSKAVSFAEFIRQRTPDAALLKRYQTHIGELLRLTTHGLFFEPDPQRFFIQCVDEVLLGLLECLNQTYGEHHEALVGREVVKLRSCLLAIGDALRSDVDAALNNDPATSDPLEVLFCYPGFKAVAAYRIAHTIFQQKLPLLPRMISEFAHQITGIDIHPGAQIGSHFFIDHGSGVVIGETTIIGDHVTLYQGVTLGAKRFRRDEQGIVIKGQARHPILGDRVTVYSGASILGRITIGAGSVIGGNVWLTESVPVNSRITQQHYLTGLFRDGDGI